MSINFTNLTLENVRSADTSLSITTETKFQMLLGAGIRPTPNFLVDWETE